LNDPLTVRARLGEPVGKIFERRQVRGIETIGNRGVLVYVPGDGIVAKALGSGFDRPERLPQHSAGASRGGAVGRRARRGNDATQMLTLAHELEAEALGHGRRRRLRFVDDAGEVVAVEQLRDGDDALSFDLTVAPLVVRAGKPFALGAGSIGVTHVAKAISPSAAAAVTQRHRYVRGCRDASRTSRAATGSKTMIGC